MLITVSPTIQRMLIELALGGDDLMGSPYDSRLLFCTPPATNTIADRAADLLATASVLGYLRDVRATAAPEAQRLTERIQSLVSELVAAQNQDGGWPWVSDGSAIPNRPQNQHSDRLTSAAVFWALASAERLGLLTDPKVLDHAAGHISREFAGLSASDWEPRGPAALALRPPSGEFRGGQQPEPRPRPAFRLRTRLPGADLCKPRSPHDRRRADRAPGTAGQDRGNRARAASATVLGSRGPPAVRAVGVRDHGARHAGLRARSGRMPPSSSGPSTGWSPIASARAGYRSRLGDRLWPPCRRSTAGPAAPRIVTGSL